jgi:hypothetical protein
MADIDFVLVGPKYYFKLNFRTCYHFFSDQRRKKPKKVFLEGGKISAEHRKGLPEATKAQTTKL